MVALQNNLPPRPKVFIFPLTVCFALHSLSPPDSATCLFFSSKLHSCMLTWHKLRANTIPSPAPFGGKVGVDVAMPALPLNLREMDLFGEVSKCVILQKAVRALAPFRKALSATPIPPPPPPRSVPNMSLNRIRGSRESSYNYLVKNFNELPRNGVRIERYAPGRAAYQLHRIARQKVA